MVKLEEVKKKAMQKLAGANNFIVITIDDKDVDNNVFINNPGAALTVLNVMNAIKNSILSSPQPSSKPRK